MDLNGFVYQKALIRTFHTSFVTKNNVCEFTAQEHKFKRLFCTQKRLFYRFLIYKNKYESKKNIIKDFIQQKGPNFKDFLNEILTFFK